MQTEFTITTWDSDRLAISGKLRDPHGLLDKLRVVTPGIKPEYLRSEAFTFSFPTNRKREVVQLVEGLE